MRNIFLVDGIIEAYGNQGVRISEKHVEVVVRQMTNRVRILDWWRHWIITW